MAYRPTLWRPVFAAALAAPPTSMPIPDASSSSFERSRSPRGDLVVQDVHVQQDSYFALSAELSRILDVNLEAEVQTTEVE